MLQVNPAVIGGLMVDLGDKTSAWCFDLHRSTFKVFPSLTFQSTSPPPQRSTDSTLLLPVSLA
jgi:hypothetical protein